MAVPALRQPKFIETTATKPIKLFSDPQYVILTLKDNSKLVISSDSYNGLLSVGEFYKCVFCAMEMELDNKYKETHKSSAKHREMTEKFPLIEEYSSNLIRKLSSTSYYCSICNVVVVSSFLSRHMTSEAHMQELQRATIRALTYKPYD